MPLQRVHGQRSSPAASISSVHLWGNPTRQVNRKQRRARSVLSRRAGIPPLGVGAERAADDVPHSAKETADGEREVRFWPQDPQRPKSGRVFAAQRASRWCATFGSEPVRPALQSRGRPLRSL